MDNDPPEGAPQEDADGRHAEATSTGPGAPVGSGETVDRPDDMPTEFKQTVQAVMMGMSGTVGRPYPPFLDRVTEGHITEMIRAANQDGQRKAEDVKHARLFGLYYLLAGVLGFLLLVAMLKSDTELCKDIVKGFAAFLMGFAGGYGYSQKRRASD
jgi:hypothetical protein